MRYLIVLAALVIASFLAVAPATAQREMACDPEEPCAPQEEGGGDDYDPIVGIESEVVDPETGELWITFITAKGERIVISFGVYQPNPDPFPEPVVDQGSPAGDAPCVDEYGEYGC